MPGPMPPQGPPAQASPDQPPGQGAAPPPEPQDNVDGQSPAMKAVSMANDGLMQLGTIFEKAKGQVSPQEAARLAKIIQEFQSLVSDFGGQGDQGKPPAAKPPGGPMDSMAGNNSTPVDQG